MNKVLLSSLFAVTLVLGGCSSSCSTQNSFKTEQVKDIEKNKIINITENVGTLADSKSWDKLANLFATKVNLDYSSMTKQPAETLTPQEIMQRWSAFLPGFDWTSHKNTNPIVKITGNKATVHSDVRATHYIKGVKDGEFWVVDGSYDYELENITGTWKITSMKLNFEKTAGNDNLPAVALKRVEK